jgi:hypothetical protein
VIDHASLIRYKTAMAVFKGWLAKGAITEADLQAIGTIIAKKHGLSSCSIFLENDLLFRGKRVINTTAKGGRQPYEDNET